MSEMRNYSYILLFLVTGLLNAQDTTLFDQGINHYSDGDYEAALDNYREILDRDKTSAAVYYNMGNAHFKLHQLGPSIFYYNKALQLSPHDEDVMNNLEIAEKQTVDAIDKNHDTGLTKMINNLIATFGFDTWAILGIGFAVVFMVFGVLYYFTRKAIKKRLFFTLSALGVVFAVFSVVFAYQQYDFQQNNKFAIVFSGEVNTHNEPNHNSGKAFALHEGTKVKVLDSFNGYAKIRLTDGKQGWIKEDAIKKL